MNTPVRSNPWPVVSIGLMGLIVGFALASGLNRNVPAPSPAPAPAPTAPSAPTPTAPTGTAPATGIGPVLGDKNATVTIVEFTDFQCPFCGRHFTETFGKIKTNYVDTGKVKYELRNFPLSSIHPNAEIGAEAAMCANAQGKFWEMHEKLFTNQATWSAEATPAATLKTYAAAIGLNAGTFAKCLDGHETQAAIQKDLADGSAAGINGTPGFWIIGPGGKTQQISGAYPYDSFKTAFDSMLN